jgi:hypothetical protein
MKINYKLNFKNKTSLFKGVIVTLSLLLSIHTNGQTGDWTVSILSLDANMGSFMINSPGSTTGIPNSTDGRVWKSATQSTFNYSVTPRPGYLIDKIEINEQSDINGNFSKNTISLNQETKYTGSISRRTITYLGYELYRTNYIQITWAKKGSGGGSTIVNETEKTSQISIYPNPANSLLTINNLQNKIGEKYGIYNNQGKLIEEGKITENNVIVETDKYTSGLYFILINGIQKLNFIKE